MIDQMFLAGESLVAHIAAMRIISAVLAHVIVEMLLARKRLVAVLAFVRRITSVKPVAVQINVNDKVNKYMH